MYILSLSFLILLPTIRAGGIIARATASMGSQITNGAPMSFFFYSYLLLFFCNMCDGRLKIVE
ncbi:hypothetical protein IF2G_07305 [Cordyceps javanica]|nr:hypothetical protein IF2G_07305 [Cordyceps javanica]